nr:hypothetical protein GCM10025730_54240 [Promicromonospora thailandica]
MRETEEETGYRVRITGLVGIYTDPRHVIVYSDGEVRSQFSICMRGAVTGGSARTSGSPARWSGRTSTGSATWTSTRRCGCGSRTPWTRAAPSPT